MGFNAGQDIPKLDWDLNPFVDLQGVVPEPTDDEIEAMNHKLRAATTAVFGEDFDPTDTKAIAKLAAKATEGQMAAMKDAQIDGLAIVTKTSPSREQLAALPPRVRMYFMQWLMKEINDPEGGKTATNA